MKLICKQSFCVYSALLGVLLLSSCGFHLRGAPELPEQFKTVAVVAKSETALVEDLRNLLQAGNITLSENDGQASAVISVNGETNSQRVLSVDNNGRAREYELKYSVVFSLLENISVPENVDQKEPVTVRTVIDKRKLELVRDYLFDTTAVLGKSREKSALIRDMQRDASRLIMLQIQAAYHASATQQTTNDSTTTNPER